MVLIPGSKMFKTDEELNKLLDHPNNKTRNVVKVLGIGQDDRSDRTPETRREKRSLEEKIDIGLLASVVGIKDAAKLIGTTPGVVSRIAAGENSQGKPDQELSARLDDRKNKLREKALEKAELFLDMVDGSGESHSEFQRIHTAEKAVTIFERLEPKGPVNQNNVQVNFYAPRMKSEEDYQVIDVVPQKG